MTPKEFSQSIMSFQERRPFEIFTLVLNDGQRLEIDYPQAIAVRDGVGVFLAPGGIPTILDNQSVKAITLGLANNSQS